MKNIKIQRIIMTITILVSLAAVAVVSIGLAFGWFLNTSQTESISAKTKGIVFSYDISDGKTTQTDVTSYNIVDVAFFDLDGEGEGNYFESMACEISLDIKNICEDNIKVTVTFTADQELTGPHLGGLLTHDKLSTDTTINTAYGTVEEILEAKKQDTSAENYVIDSIVPESNETVYLYIFGIQPDDSADNTFFSSSYGFSLNIRAVKEADE